MPRNASDQFLCRRYAFDMCRAKIERGRRNGKAARGVMPPEAPPTAQGVMPPEAPPKANVLFRSLVSERLVELSADRIGSLTREALRKCNLFDWQPHHLRMVAASVCAESGMSTAHVLMAGGWRSEQPLRTRYLAQLEGAHVMSCLNDMGDEGVAHSDTSACSDGDEGPEPGVATRFLKFICAVNGTHGGGQHVPSMRSVHTLQPHRIHSIWSLRPSNFVRSLDWISFLCAGCSFGFTALPWPRALDLCPLVGRAPPSGPDQFGQRKRP